MSLFRTVISVEKNKYELTHTDKILSVGSCFAQNMGSRLARKKFQIANNPFGVIYNPLSIINNLKRVLIGEEWKKNELYENNGLWQSFDHHSSFSDSNPSIVLERISTSFELSKDFISNGRFLILTFGSAFTYSLKKTEQVVANCHKFSSTDFEKRSLTVSEIVESCGHFFNLIREVNPNLKVLLTVSPVRHIKEGHVANQQSKATLILAVQELCQKFENISYFPAYEIMMDDLRDYRFYEKDMIHPSELAIDYIWNLFEETLINRASKDLGNQMEKLVQASEHRPFQGASEQHQQFVKKQLSKINSFCEQYPQLDLQKEKAIFEKQLL